MPTYSDIPYDLTINEFGDIDLLEDSEAIRQSLKTIVLTRIGAKMRFQNPIFGSGVGDLLFEKINPFTVSSLEEEVTQAIENWEPRVNVEAVDIETDSTGNGIKASIAYTIVNLNITDSLVINLSVLN